MSPQNPVRALKYRNFRLLWIGEVLRTSAHWMDVLTRGLLILEITGSAADVALVMAARALPLSVIGLWGGLLADRLDRRKLLLASRTLNVTSYIVLAGCVFTAWTPMWVIYATAVIVGFGQALNGPARQSLLPSLVPPHELRSAVVLNAATLNLGQAIGPVIGGWAVSLVGLGPTFLLQAVLILVGGLLISRIEVAGVSTKPTERMLRSALDGFRYVIDRPLLLGLFALAATGAILVDPFRGVAPAIAVEQLGTDPALSGTLMGALGMGAVLAVLMLGVFPSAGASWRLIAAGAAGFAASVTCFALSSRVGLSAIALFIAGFSQACFRTQAQSLQLSETEDRFRGRVTSVWVAIRGTEPAGSFVLAGLTVVFGVGIGLSIMTLTALVAIGLIVLFAARAKKRRESR